MFHRTFPIVETTHTGGVLDCDTHIEILNKLQVRIGAQIEIKG